MQIINTSNELKIKNDKEIIKIQNEAPSNSSCINKKKSQIIILIVLILLILILIIIVIIILNKPDSQKNINCKDGYFLEKNNIKCFKCSITNCKQCEGSLINNTCISCFSSHKPKLLNNKIISCELFEQKEINDSIIKYSNSSDETIEESDTNKLFYHNYTNINSNNINQTDNYEYYKTNKEISTNIFYFGTNSEEITINEVVCEPGYFRDPDSNTCHECTVNNCEICTGNINNDLCTSCFERFFPTYQSNYIISCDYCQLGDREKCLECDNINFTCSRCNDGFQLSNGQCISEYSFEAIYETNSYNQNIELINKDFLRHINKMVIDGEDIRPTSNLNIHNPGNHTVYFKMDNKTNIFSQMFFNITNLISLYSYSNFNTLYVEDMDEMFSNCLSLTYLNLSSFITFNTHNMYSMFSNCRSLKYLDISNFKVHYINYFDCRNIFSSINSDVTIYTNSAFKSALRTKGEDIGLRFKII